jgi:hypothetical protein
MADPDRLIEWTPLRVTFPVPGRGEGQDPPELYGLAIMVGAWEVATREQDAAAKDRMATWLQSWLDGQRRSHPANITVTGSRPNPAGSSSGPW